MRFSYRILPEKRLAILRFRGSLSVTDITQSVEAFWQDQAYTPELNGIVRLERVTTKARVEDLKVLLDFLESRPNTQGSWAAVFTDPKATALALMFKAVFRASFALEIVSSWEAAQDFLRNRSSEPTAALSI